jgi:adenosylmethionine---8-amino-7-oxononanoate aminotransferase
VIPVDELLALDRRHVWHPFTQAATAPDPIPIRAAHGAHLIAADGREYLDLISSWWVTLHGHAHPAIAAAVARQAAELEQVIFAGFTHEPAVQVAARLAALLPDGLERVFFSDDGSTSVEVALKLAYQYWWNRGEPRRRRFLAFEGGYHGDTFGAMSAGQSSGFYRPFRDLLFSVDLLPFPETWDGDPSVQQKEATSLDALDAWIGRCGREGVALIMEPLVQGAAGMRMCRPQFVRAVSERLRAAGLLFILDEVMTGFGRTGATFACLKAGVAPDLVCLSKGLTGGFLPMAATVCRPEIYEAFLGGNFERAFAHGHSFTANPLGCAAALASLDLLQSDETTARLAAIESVHGERLPRLARNAKLTRPRRCGTIAAVTFGGADQGYSAAMVPQLKAFFLERGLLIRPLGPVVYLLPPFCVTKDELHRAYDAIEEAAATLTN